MLIIYFNQFISEIFIGDNFTEYSPQLIPLFAVMFFIWGTKRDFFEPENQLGDLVYRIYQMNQLCDFLNYFE